MKQKLVKRKRKFKTVDWKELQAGDIIKIIGGHGPHMIVGNKEKYIGARSGNYKVKRIEEEGMVVIKDNSYSFIYMGPRKNTALGYTEPHKFKKCLT